jgi:energy-coupling factor transporter transmembrane protein EcfT
MDEEIVKYLYEIPKSPVVWMILLFGFFTFCISFRVVREFSEAMETVGISISKKDRKKWRNLFSTILGIIFITFLFLYVCVTLFRY